jgi:colanic acid/amylovoran biosynthesis glycosyltransferase
MLNHNGMHIDMAVSEQQRLGRDETSSEVPRRSPLRMAYLVSRFPKTTETFIVRELNAISARDDIDARLCSLFPAGRGTATVHPSAAPWLDRVQRPSQLAAMGALVRWLVRRPWTVTTTVLLLAAGFWRKPDLLVRSLASMVVACAHAERFSADDIEHVHAHFFGHTATAAWVIHRLTDIPYSVTAHAYDLFLDQEFLERRVRDARFIVTISHFNADFIFSYCRGKTPPITVIRAGIDPQMFPFTEHVLPAVGPLRALSVGSFLTHKGHRVLLDALSCNDPEIQRIHLTLVGDGEERRTLEMKVSEQSLADRVDLVGAQTEDRVRELMLKADLFILPSLIDRQGRMEGVPVVLMEALASGVPAIATRLSGIPELIEDGVTGTLAEQGDPESLRDSIRELIANPNRAAAMARRGRQRVEDEFDVKNSATALASRLLAAHPADRRDGRRRPAFVAWSRSRRSQELAAATASDCHVMFLPSLTKPWLVPLRYAISAGGLLWFMLRRRPSVVVATNPPIFPALITYLAGRLTGSQLVLDSHPRGFGRKGSRMGTLLSPMHRWLVMHARTTLVASAELATEVERWGGRSMLLHEALPMWAIDSTPVLGAQPCVLWLSIFANDEPVEVVFGAADQLPDITFMITGDTARCPAHLLAQTPANVAFTGFCVDEAFRRLIESADVVLVLTTEPTSVPRAAFEAVEALRPLVISDLPGVRPLFPDAVFVANEPSAVAHGVEEAIARHAELAQRAPAARDRQRSRWYGQLGRLTEILDELPTT